MFIAKIQRYSSRDGNTDLPEIALPSHTCVTGKEDYFALAYDDTRMIVAVMRELDKALGNDKDEKGREIVLIYRIKSVEDR